jgi:hypothetical protein
MRGRAAEIADAGAYGWEVVWEALKTEPPADDPSTITQELGLGEEDEIIQTNADVLGTAFSGTRHGRHVVLRMGVVPSLVRARGYNEVEVTGPVAPFRVGERDDRPVAEPGSPPAVEEVLAGIAPASGVWRDVEIEGGPNGIVARRPVKAHPQGYVYDLWLAERIADRMGA